MPSPQGKWGPNGGTSFPLRSAAYPRPGLIHSIFSLLSANSMFSVASLNSKFAIGCREFEVCF